MRFRKKVKYHRQLVISGEFIHKDIVPSNLPLMNSISSLQGEEKNLFLVFVRTMLQWLPEDIKTARELLENPWLNGRYKGV